MAPQKIQNFDGFKTPHSICIVCIAFDTGRLGATVEIGSNLISFRCRKTCHNTGITLFLHQIRTNSRLLLLYPARKGRRSEFSFNLLAQCYATGWQTYINVTLEKFGVRSLIFFNRINLQPSVWLIRIWAHSIIASSTATSVLQENIHLHRR